jgi:hypothetical protein
MPRTADEIAHETAAPLASELILGKQVAAVIVSELLPLGNGIRTVWRFINCNDPKVQAITLRQIADLIEQTAASPTKSE